MARFPPFARSHCCSCWHRSAARAAKPGLAMPLGQPLKNPLVMKVPKAWVGFWCTAKCILTGIAALASFPARCPRILVTVRRIRWRRLNPHVGRFPARWRMSHILQSLIPLFSPFLRLRKATTRSRILPRSLFWSFVSDSVRAFYFLRQLIAVSSWPVCLNSLSAFFHLARSTRSWSIL